MRKKITAKILAFIVIVAVVAFVLFWMRPAKVVEKSFDKLANSRTQTFSAVISVSNPQASVDILGEQASIELNVSGKFKRENDKRDSVDAVVKLSTKTETTTMMIEANTRFIGEQAYFQIIEAPATFPSLAQLKGQWIELPRGMQKDVSELPASSKAFLEIETGENKEIDGVEVKTYKVMATAAAVVRMLDSMASILGTHLTAEQISNIQLGVAAAETLPVELAITPWSREIRQIKSSTVVPGSDNTMSIEFTFRDRNQSVEITVPENAQTLSSLAGASINPL